MKFINWQKLSQKKYSYLLWSLIILFVTTSLIDFSGLGKFFLGALYYCAIIFALSTFKLRKIVRYTFIIIATLGFAFKVIPAPYFEHYFGFNLFLLGKTIDILFSALAIRLIIRKISLATRVTQDTLRGGISIYLLIGLSWGQLYNILYTLDSHSFSRPVISHQLFYFSFTTLTTLGYGDIVPVSKIAMTLANIEAIIGQMFPAIFIARLVSLYAPQE